MRAPIGPVAVRTAGLAAVAGAGSLVAAADDSPDANIGLGILLLGVLVLTVVLWGGVDGVRTARRGRPDREGLLVWLLTAAAFGVLSAGVTAVGVAVTEDELPLGALLGASVTWAGFVAVPGAVAFGLARTLTEARIRRRRRIG